MSRLRIVGKMVRRHEVKGWNDFVSLVEKLEIEKKPINVLFTGDKNELGESWCPYCVRGNLKIKRLT